jgi:hypothetical protein
MQRQLRACGLGLLCLCGLVAAGTPVEAVAAGGIPLLLAQATPAPVALPPNVQKAGRLYVIESVVVLALIGGAVYAVCRTSRRT